MKQKILIFDFDGTIANSFDQASDILHENVLKYTKYTISKKEIKNLLRNESIFKIMKKYKIKKWQIPFMTIKIRRDIKKIIKTVKPFEGIKKTLKKLSKDHKIIILSSNSKKNIMNFLIENNIEDYISQIHSSVFLLNKEHSINSIIRKNRLNKDNVFYIGDEIRDVEAAKKADVKCIAVSYGFNSKKLLQTIKPYKIISSVSELEKILV